jgi:hypothetical protein
MMNISPNLRILRYFCTPLNTCSVPPGVGIPQVEHNYSRQLAAHRMLPIFQFHAPFTLHPTRILVFIFIRG